jgi:hypothetical protein
MGAISQDMGEWALGIMNGEGYTSGPSPQYATNTPAFIANLRLMPVTEATVGVSFLWDERNVYTWENAAYTDEELLGKKSRTAISAMARYGRGFFNVLGEYLYYDHPIPDRDNPQTGTQNVKAMAFTVFPVVRLTQQLDLVGRYDYWDPDSDSDKSIWNAPGDWTGATPSPWWVPREYAPGYYYVKHNVYALGFNYNITERMKGDPGVILQVNWQRMSPSEDLGEQGNLDDTDYFTAQLRWGWGGLEY